MPSKDGWKLKERTLPNNFCFVIVMKNRKCLQVRKTVLLVPNLEATMVTVDKKVETNWIFTFQHNIATEQQLHVQFLKMHRPPILLEISYGWTVSRMKHYRLFTYSMPFMLWVYWKPAGLIQVCKNKEMLPLNTIYFFTTCNNNSASHTKHE